MTTKEFEMQLALGSLSIDDKIKLADNYNKRVLTILSTDEYWYIRCKVAANPNTPIKVLTKLLKDKDYTVSNRADIHLETIGNTYIDEE